MKTMVIAGATGFVGRHLSEALIAAGATVRCGTRNVARARRAAPDRTWVRLDVDDADSLAAALTGADTLFYLVHQMREGHDGLPERESASARRVRDAAQAAGLRRIVYLGGPAPAEGCSDHLQARLGTGEILRSGSVTTVELRAAMIVGPGSESWLIVRDLAMRLPLMILPRWLANRTRPIGIDDVVQALMAAIDLPLDGSQWFDLPGPEILTGRQILERVAAQAGMRPLMLPVPVLTPSLSSHWLRLVTRADYQVARQLVDGLVVDLLPSDEGLWPWVPHLQCTPFDEAVGRALAAESPMSSRASTWERWVRRVARSDPTAPLNTAMDGA